MKLSLFLLASAIGARKNKKNKKQKNTCADGCPDFTICGANVETGTCEVKNCSLYFKMDEDEKCVPDNGSANGVVLNRNIDNNISVITTDLFGSLIKKNKRRKNTLNVINAMIDEIHEFIGKKIDDFTLASDDSFTYQGESDKYKCYYQSAPTFEHATGAFEAWKAHYTDELNSLEGIFRSEFEVTHGSLFYATEDLVDVYRQLVYDMVDNCKNGGDEDCSGPHEFCVNNIDDYTCQCHAGFEMKDGACVDIDECIAGNHNCDHENQICHNLIGYNESEMGFTCACKEGFEQVDPVTEGRSFFQRQITEIKECNDPNHIVDINECLPDTPENPMCEDPNSYCSNKVGGYRCLCAGGYALFRDTPHESLEGTGRDPDQATKSVGECEAATTLIVKMDFTNAPKPDGRKRRAVDPEDTNGAFQRVKQALIDAGIDENDIIMQVFMTNEWAAPRACSHHEQESVTQGVWDNLTADRQINSFLFFTIAIRQSAIDGVFNLDNTACSATPMNDCRKLGTIITTAALDAHNTCRSLRKSFTIFDVTNNGVHNWRDFLPDIIVNPSHSPYGRKRRDAEPKQIGAKKLARRERKKNKSGNVAQRTEGSTEEAPADTGDATNAAATNAAANFDQGAEYEFQSCDMMEFVDYKIGKFKEYLLEKFNQFSLEELNQTHETIMQFGKK